MAFRDVFKRSSYRHTAGEAGQAFVARLAQDGMPSLGYAEALRWPVLELCRQVTVLHREVEDLKQQVAQLRDGPGAAGATPR